MPRPGFRPENFKLSCMTNCYFSDYIYGLYYHQNEIIILQSFLHIQLKIRSGLSGHSVVRVYRTNYLDLNSTGASLVKVIPRNECSSNQNPLSSDYPLVFVFTLLLFLYYLCFSQFIQSYHCVGYMDQ